MGCPKLTYYDNDIEALEKNFFFTTECLEKKVCRRKNRLDYYPFGMPMPGRSFSSNQYRYGFNGMEKDDEMGKGDGNSYDFGARIYDPRLGRWLAVDPLTKKYPHLSPYNFVTNNPIIFVDPDGRIIKVATKDGQKQTIKILAKAFGKKADNFSFNNNNELVFAGDPSSFTKAEGEVLTGVLTVIKSPTVTNIRYAETKDTRTHGGEITQNTTDNPSFTENIITIDPKDKPNITAIHGSVEYVSERGNIPTLIVENAKKDALGRPVTTGNVVYREGTVKGEDSKSSRFFHGLGHILYQKNSEQENVIKYENKARAIFKKKTIFGKYKSKPEKKRSIDSKHTNKPD